MSWLDKLHHKFNLHQVLNTLSDHPIIVNSRKRRHADDDDDDYFGDDDDDDWCNDVNLDAVPTQQGGGGAGKPTLLNFSLKQTALPVSWKNTIHKTRFAADLHQQREAEVDDNLAYELTDAIRRALLSAVNTQTLQPRDKIHFTLQADAFSAASNHCFQSATFTIALRRG